VNIMLRLLQASRRHSTQRDFGLYGIVEKSGKYADASIGQTIDEWPDIAKRTSDVLDVKEPFWRRFGVWRP